MMMSAVGLLFYLLMIAISLVSLACFVMVLVKMFQDGQTVLAVVSIVLAICSGFGVLIVFVVGWINAAKWGIRNLMIVWSLSFVLSIAVGIVMFAVMGASMMHEMQGVDDSGPGRQLPPTEFRLSLPVDELSL